MKWKLMNDAAQKTYALIFESGDEVMSLLTAFAKENNLKASQFTAIGAFENAQLGFFDFSLKEYKQIPVNEQVEVLSINGDIAIHENKPVIHAHVVLGKSDGSTVGGHLIKAQVRPTLEVILNESPSFLQKKIDSETGLALISL
jgi:uncharacterized protein